MTNQLQRHIATTVGTKQRVFSEAIEEALLKRLGWQNPVASGVGGYIIRDDFGKVFSHLLVTDIAVQSIITDSLKSFWQNVLNHSSHELECREAFMLDLSCFMVSIPVADSLSVVSFNPANRDRRRNDILCQILSQPLSTWGYLSGLKESDKAFGIISPGSVDVFFNGRIGNLFSEHFQEMVLPFSVHHVVRDVGDILPLFQRIKPTCGHEYMKVGVVMAGSSGGLENDDVSHVEFDAGAGVENIFETGITCSHERAEQCRIAVKPYSQELRHGQYDMTISYAGEEPPADEVCPSVGISLGTGKTEAGFAGESDTPHLSALAASVLNKAHLVGIAAVEHFLDSLVVVRTIKAWSELLKRIPVIIENLLECFFVNAFHGCFLRTTIPELTKQVEKRMSYAKRLKSPRRSRDKFIA